MVDLTLTPDEARLALLCTQAVKDFGHGALFLDEAQDAQLRRLVRKLDKRLNGSKKHQQKGRRKTDGPDSDPDPDHR